MSGSFSRTFFFIKKRKAPAVKRRLFVPSKDGEVLANLLAAVDGLRAELFLDAEELVVLRDAVGAAH